MGSTGQGKSSGSGRALALAYLRAGFGGLVLTAKRDERRVWEAYCREAKRENDLLVVEPNGRWTFNPFAHEATRKGAGAGQTENIVCMLMAILELVQRGSGGSGGGREDEGYWARACRQLLRAFTELLLQATGTVAVKDLYRAIISAPQSQEELASDRWKETYCCQLLRMAQAREKTVRQRHDFELVADYILIEFPGLSEKTRSIVVSSFTSMIDVLQRGILRELFGGDSTFTPEASEHGRIILVDLPIKEFGEIGLIANVLVKYAWQKATERRDLRENPRPVFLFVDEAHHFLGTHDFLFQTTCRSARVASVLLTQNVNTLRAALGGNEKGRMEADALAANLQTKIWHGNGDPTTNEWASTMIGREKQYLTNASTSYGVPDLLSTGIGGHTSGCNAGMSEQWEFEVQPSVFSSLRGGGPANEGRIDAIVFQSGRTFYASGKSWMPVHFQQTLS